MDRDCNFSPLMVIIEVCLTLLALVVNPWLAIVIMFSLIIIRNKTYALRVSCQFQLHSIADFFPILVEYCIILIIMTITTEKASVVWKVSVDLNSALIFLLQRIGNTIREELITTFYWFFLSLSISNLVSSHGKPLVRINKFTIGLALCFGFIHLVNLREILPHQRDPYKTVLHLVGTVYNGFCLGYYLKSLFIKRFSLLQTIIAHILINLPRFFNSIYAVDYQVISLQYIYVLFLAPTLFLTYTIFILNKKFDSNELKLLLCK